MRPNATAHSSRTAPTAKPKRAAHRVLKRSAIIAGVVAFFFVLIRFIASPWLTAEINRKLRALPHYSGHVQAIHLALWRGDISARELELTARGHEHEGPVIKLKHAAIRVSWGALFRRKVGGSAVLDGAEI